MKRRQRRRTIATTLALGASALVTGAATAQTAPGAPPIDVSIDVSADPGLGANPAFLDPAAGVTGVDCVLPEWSNDPLAAEAFYSAAIYCHDAAWRPTFDSFGLELTLPPLWAGAESAAYVGACGSNTTGREAFYCSLDGTIVMPFDSMSTVAEYGPGYTLAVLSHEYGHHLQNEFGVSAAYWGRRQAVGVDSDVGQLLSRQFELQAWCLSGMFYGTSTGRGSLTTELADQAFDNNSQAGDRPGELREHGTNESIASWFGWGQHPSLDPEAAVAPSLYECNPWAARDASTLE